MWPEIRNIRGYSVLKIYLTTVTPHFILFQDALLPIVAPGLIGLQFLAICLLVIYLPFSVRTHVQAWPQFLLVGVLPTSATATAVCIGRYGSQFCILGGDRSCKLLHHCLVLLSSLLDPSIANALAAK